MRYTLPTQHILYFGLQAKKTKIDASGVTKPRNANVAEIHHQALMMLAHEIFDLESNRRVLVDHAFIVAGEGRRWSLKELRVRLSPQVNEAWVRPVRPTIRKSGMCEANTTSLAYLAGLRHLSAVVRLDRRGKIGL